MRHLKTLFFFACCFAVGVGIAMAVMKIRGHHDDPPTVLRDAGNAPPLRGFSLPLDAAASSALDRIAALHASTIALSYPAVRGARSAASSQLPAIVAHAHHLGMKVLLLPPPGFSLQNPYPAALATIAAEARSAHVDMLCLSWLDSDPDPAYWRSQAADARRIFPGPLVLAATPDILPGLEFTDCAEFLGAIGPIQEPRRLPHAHDDVDLHALRVGWDCILDSLESFAVKSGKPIILLNMSIAQTNRAKLDSPRRPPPAPTPDPALQLLAYRALLFETRGRQAIDGLLLPLPERAVTPASVAQLLTGLQAQWGPASSQVVTSGAPAPPAGSQDNVDPG